jgi:hypothetical protein
MTTTQPAIKVPLSERINLRVVVFVGVVVFLVGYPIYVLIDAQVSGGVKNAAGGFKLVDLKAMSTFEFDQANGAIDDIPRKWRDLDGQKVILHGEMWAPSGAGNTVDSFELCYSIAKCCFSGPPLVQHFVHVTPLRGAQLGYYNGQVEVKGILHIKVERDAGKVSRIYAVEAQSVEPIQ